ncbi:lambda exonuclease family protein [Sphingopyxis sp. NJF-3]
MDANPFSPDYRAPDPAPVEDRSEPAEKVGRGRVVYHRDVIQGTAEWMKLRTGVLTASEMSKILTPTLKVANNDKARSHLWELLAQRITGFVEESFESWDTLRGREDEMEARMVYSQHYAPVEECGFITNDEWGFTLGYSPDGLVGDDGLIECKSRKQKYQVETIVEYAAKNTIPTEFMLQHQTGLVVSKRKWIDFISYSGGLPMSTTRVDLLPEYEDAILSAAEKFEADLSDKRAIYDAMIASGARLVPTERSDRGDIQV